MTSRLFTPKNQLQLSSRKRWDVLYKNLRAISGKQDQPTEQEHDENIEPSKVSEKSPVWLNIKSGIFGPKDYRMPLPGDIGVSRKAAQLLEEEMANNSMSVGVGEGGSKRIDLEHYYEMSKRILQSEMKWKAHVPKNYEDADYLDCKIYSCPQLLKKDLLTLFPDRSSKDNLMVIVLCQKAENDMSTWSEEVEEEREKLISYFIQGAKRICDDIKKTGAWADFIDPTSGRPYLGPYTNHTFFETDERYRHFGFRIEDLGCCRVISHRKWGTNIFVGAIFTNSRFESVELWKTLGKYGSRLEDT